MINQWNKAYGIAGQVQFSSGEGDMPTVTIENALGKAVVAMQGAHVLSFQASGQAPLIWLSDDAVFSPGKALRGGVPICWPWFGPHHDADTGFPAHGPVRTMNWQPVATEMMADGRTQISFEIVEFHEARQSDSHPLRVRLKISVGRSLALALETTNLGSDPFVLGEAFHAYFYVGDVNEAKIEGLSGCDYIDKMDNSLTKTQHGDVIINAETDRIYLGTKGNCAIVDPTMNRKIVVSSEGSASTVVWNPWIERADEMGDLGQEGYLNMLCVETANAASDVIHLAAGETHCLIAEYASESLEML